MSSLRTPVLEHIYREGGNLPSAEIATAMKADPVKVRNCLKDASKDGYVIFGRDDVTGQGGYSLTDKGRARVKAGHQSINGKSAEENKAASDALEAEAHVMSVPQVDPVALAEANKILAEKAAGLSIHIDALQKRIEGLEQDREKQRKLLASKIERIAELEKEVAELQDCTADELVVTVARLIKENAELRSKRKEEDSINDYDLKRQPIAWAHVWSDGFAKFNTEEDARADIQSTFSRPEASANDSSHLLCAIIDTAELSIKWARS